MEDIVAVVAERIAQRVAPEEIDSAADLARAAVAGGRAWKRLQIQRGDATFGGFGHELVSDLLPIFGGLKDAAADLAPFMAVAASGMTVAVHLRTLIEKVRTPATQRPEVVSGGTRSEEGAAEAHRQLSGRLVAHGFKQPQAEQIAADVLAVLTERPEDGRAFLSSLASR
jgi:hypothetical protein